MSSAEIQALLKNGGQLSSMTRNNKDGGWETINKTAVDNDMNNRIKGSSSGNGSGYSSSEEERITYNKLSTKAAVIDEEVSYKKFKCSTFI
jgi:hypothetical protein